MADVQVLLPQEPAQTSSTYISRTAVRFANRHRRAANAERAQGASHTTARRTGPGRPLNALQARAAALVRVAAVAHQVRDHVSSRARNYPGVVAVPQVSRMRQVRQFAELARPGAVAVINGRVVEGPARTRSRRVGATNKRKRRQQESAGTWDSQHRTEQHAPVEAVAHPPPRPQRRVLAGERVWREVRQRADQAGWRLVREATSHDFYGEGNPILQTLLFTMSQQSVSGGGLSRYFLSEAWRERDSYLNMEGNPPASTYAIENLAPLPAERAVEEELECAICQDCFGTEEHTCGKLLPCKHAFHHKCAEAWLQQHNTCPSCRAEIESTCPKYNRQNCHKMLGVVREEAMAPEAPAEEGWKSWTAPSFMYDDELR